MTSPDSNTQEVKYCTPYTLLGVTEGVLATRDQASKISGQDCTHAVHVEQITTAECLQHVSSQDAKETSHFHDTKDRQSMLRS